MDRKQINLRLPDITHARLVHAGVVAKKSRNAIIVEAVEAWLKNYGAPREKDDD